MVCFCMLMFKLIKLNDIRTCCYVIKRRVILFDNHIHSLKFKITKESKLQFCYIDCLIHNIKDIVFITIYLLYIFVNDPSAGSPTETLLRLLLPLDDKV